jgi:hypothetical protein
MSQNQRQLVKFLEKYCINSQVRLHNKDMMNYWYDPVSSLREFDPTLSEVDKTIYNFIVPAKRRTGLITSLDLGSDVDMEEVHEEDSDDD